MFQSVDFSLVIHTRAFPKTDCFESGRDKHNCDGKKVEIVMARKLRTFVVK